VHEQLAPALAGTDGQQAANAESKAEPCGNQRGGVQAAGAQKPTKPRAINRTAKSNVTLAM